MKKLSLAIVFFFITIFWISAQTAVITELAGTVEYKHAGEADWKIASRGMSLASDTVISTGFKSSALLQMGSSVITVKPLTRLTLAELSAASGSETINVSLQAGRIRVSVDPPQGVRTSMTVRGPSATASVRGTEFEFDTLNLVVLEGTVEFTGSSSLVPVIVDGGRFSYLDEQSGRGALPEDTALLDLKPELPVGSKALPSMDQTTPAENTVELQAGIKF